MMYKNVFKKIISFIIVFFLVLVVIGCKDKNELKVDIIDSIYVGETFCFSIKVLPNNVEVDDFDFEIEDKNIIEVKGKTIKGVQEGETSIKITVYFNNKLLTTTKKISVIKNHVAKEIEVLVKDNLKVNEEATIKVLEKDTKIEVPSFELFITDKDILSFNRDTNTIKGLKKGVTTISVVCEIDGINITKQVQVQINEDTVFEDLIMTNIPETLRVNQIIKVSLTLIDTVQEIEDFNIVVSDLDLIEFYEENKELEAYEVGNIQLTITANYNGVSYTLVKDIVIIEALYIESNMPEEIYIDDIIDIDLIIQPVNVKATEFVIENPTLEIIEANDNKIKGLKEGSIKIYFDCVYENVHVYTSVVLNVVKFIPDYLVTSITNDYMFVNESYNLDVLLMPKNETIEDFNVFSSDESVISYVSSDRSLLAKKTGIATITIVKGELSVAFTVSVYEFTGIDLIIDESLFVNQVKPYKVIAKPSLKELTSYTFTSSDNSILINSKAIFATKSCNSNITVAYSYMGNDYSSSVTVSSINKIYPIERLYINGANGLLVGSSMILEVTKYPEVGVGEIEIESLNPDIATIDGLTVTGLKEGKCGIVAKVKDNENIKNEFIVTVIGKKQLSETTNAIYNGNPINARYYEDSINNYNELNNGVIQVTYNAYTSTQLSGDVDGYSGITGEIEKDKFYSQQVNLLKVPSSVDTLVIPWANLNSHKWTLTTVKGLIENYEEKNPGYKVIAAVNGDFFDINANGNLPYQTTGENITNGEFYKTTNGFGGDGGTIGFINDGSKNSLIASHNATRTTYMVLAIYNEQNEIIKEFKVNSWNQEPNESETSVFFGTYNSEKNYVSIKVSENSYLIENAILALPNNKNDFYGLGKISAVGSKDLQIGDFAIKTNNDELKEYLNKYPKVRVQFEYTGEFEKVKSSTGFNAVVYEDVNNINITNDNLLNRAPRTVIGVKEDGTILMMVIDGRQGANNMYGADGYELSAIMKAYGCIKCYNVDGGGSSTIVIRTEKGLQVLNSPSDGRERSDGNCILIVSKDPLYETNIQDLTENSAVIKVSTENKEFKDLKTYVLIDNLYYPVVNGVVELNGLVHNTTYNYRICYEKASKIYQTQTMGSFKTKQSLFEFLGFTIKDNGDAFILNSYALDVDKASNIMNMQVTINGLQIFLTNGTLSIKKSIFGDEIKSVELMYWYQDGVNTITVNDDKPIYFLY